MPIKNLSSPYLSCNIDGSAVAGATHAEIKAGDSITAHYNNKFPWNDKSIKHNDIFYCDPASGLSCIWQHWIHSVGPILAYMAACDGDCSSLDTSKLKWFKIFEAGLRPNHTIRDLDGWYQDDAWSVTIPKNLKPGNYLIRHEILYIEEWLEVFPECAQLKVTGSGTKIPDESYLVQFPGAYSETGMYVHEITRRILTSDVDPGIAISYRFYEDGYKYTVCSLLNFSWQT
jgi:hypothetical protein